MSKIAEETTMPLLINPGDRCRGKLFSTPLQGAGAFTYIAPFLRLHPKGVDLSDPGLTEYATRVGSVNLGCGPLYGSQTGPGTVGLSFACAHIRIKML